ncbi:MAG TPA: cobalamin-dependent protein [Terriglobales bacterium]|nr:cobalamin-dependent protein [Terriglobales bacterium]
MPTMEEIKNALSDLNEDTTLQLVQDALREGHPAFEILKACQEGMTDVGKRFECQDYFVSDLMMSGEIFKQISALLEPHLKAGGAQSAGKIVFGTVKGDIHDIGKDIVINMLKSANFEVIDLGVDVSPDKFVSAIKESGATVVGMSGLLTLAFDSMKATISALETAGVRKQVRVMIGGGPVDGNVCKIVGADDWGSDAQQAVKLAKGWLEAVPA